MTNILIAYFSHKGNNYVSGRIINLEKGNTAVIAEKIQEFTGGDLFEIKTAKTYPLDYYETTEVAKTELSSNTRPELSENLSDVTKYDTIILGYPNWWGTMPAAVMTFLESYDFTDKIIMPFCTHEGSAMGHSENDLMQCCPNSIIKQGLPIKGSNVHSSDLLVKNWLDLNL